MPGSAKSRSWSPVRHAMVASCVLLAVAFAGCGSKDDKGDSAAADATSAATSEAAVPSIVGEWQRTQTCEELVGLLRKAGMAKAIPEMIAGDGWIPGVEKPSQIGDPSHPCQQAVARKHSHFFTADGQFGSRDAAGEQVDDGAYELEGADHVVIGGVTFQYRITDDTIMFAPVVPACAPDCFDAQWSVAVAYEGYPWHRVG